MAQIKLVCASILLVLSLFQSIHSSEGRNLKSLRKNEFPKLTSHSINFEKETKEIGDQNSNLPGESTNRPTYTNEFVLKVPTSPMAPTQGVDEPRPPPPAPGHFDDFRPTAPGNSPGVGHFLQTSPMAPNQGVDEPRPPPPAPGHVDDFRPTAPGHSPGVGHFLQN